MYQIWIIIIIMLAAGLLGGWAGYLTDAIASANVSDEVKRYMRRRYLVLGVTAAGCIPLFLKLVQSALITDIFATKQSGSLTDVPFEDFLVFGGFCLVAAVSARAFLDTMSRQILRDVSRASQRADEATSTARQAADEADTAVEIAEEASRSKGIEPDPDLSEQGDVASAIEALPSLSPTERRALAAMMRMKFRTATGISRDSEVPRAQIGEVLDALVAKGLAKPAVSPNTGGQRWQVTSLGVRSLSKRLGLDESNPPGPTK